MSGTKDRQSMSRVSLGVQAESWPLAKAFVIARGSKNSAQVVTVALAAGGKVGRGECVPYTRYGESVDSVISEIEAMRVAIEGGLDRAGLQTVMPAGAARNAIDCALWDLEAKQSGESVYSALGMAPPKVVPSVETISIGAPEVMQRDAAALSSFPIIKVKLDTDAVMARMKAVRAGAPDAKLIIDANESWPLGLLQQVAPDLAALGVVMIEQPLKAGDDALLAEYTGPVPLGADESCHTCADLARLAPYYAYVNIKLDKTGGLTEALKMQAAARALGLGVMVGSMVSTSLALAPAVVLAVDAGFVDLDSPNLLAKDRPHAMTLKDGKLANIDLRLWGGAQI
jgi:L-Ala-D/L-Glu epimerase / N-acetyl-D-glutamate racemase